MLVALPLQSWSLSSHFFFQMHIQSTRAHDWVHVHVTCSHELAALASHISWQACGWLWKYKMIAVLRLVQFEDCTYQLLWLCSQVWLHARSFPICVKLSSCPWVVCTVYHVEVTNFNLIFTTLCDDNAKCVIAKMLIKFLKSEDFVLQYSTSVFACKLASTLSLSHIYWLFCCSIHLCVRWAPVDVTLLVCLSEHSQCHTQQVPHY